LTDGLDWGAVPAGVERVRAAIARESPHPSSVAIVAVTKGFPLGAVLAARATGVSDIGENYAAELVQKAARLASEGSEESHPIRWHFLGVLQRNKLRRLAPIVSCYHGVARVAEGEEIARQGGSPELLVELDTTGDRGRNGVAAGEVAGLVAGLRRLELDVRGLMTVAPPDPRAARAAFATLAEIADDLGLPERSMGMSEDYEVALAMGSTMVRIGRALFGPRPFGKELAQ